MFNPPLKTWPFQYYRALWWAVLMLTLLPAIILALDYLNKNLGVNGLETLERVTGRWAVVLLILTLFITPGRSLLLRLFRLLGWRWGKRQPDWNFMIHMRRMLGLVCFFYGLAHAWVYLEFDLSWDWSALFDDLNEKPYIVAGVINLALLALLAITSPDKMIRMLKRNWRRIHRLIYLIALLSIAHWWWMSKPGDFRSLPYILALLALLAYRLVVWRNWFSGKDADDGMPVAPRESPHA